MAACTWPSNSNLSQTLKKAKYLKVTQLLSRQSVPTTFYGCIVSKLPTQAWNKAKISRTTYPSENGSFQARKSLYNWRILIGRIAWRTPPDTRRCWTRSEGHHGEKIKNGSFASDLRSVHISRYAIKIPGEIVWYGHYRSSSAFKGHNMRCSFEIFLRKGGRNRRLLLASQNCYFLCRRDNFGIEATRYVSTLRSYMCLKCLILNVSFSLVLFSPQMFFQVHWRVHEGHWSSHRK